MDVFLMKFWILALLFTLCVPDFCYARPNGKSIGPEGGYIHGIAIDAAILASSMPEFLMVVFKERR